MPHFLPSPMLDRFDCYELCVQSPRHITTFLRNLHGNDPRTLAEDFCGTAAVSRRWIADARRARLDASAIAIDLDPATLAKARALAARESVADAITLLEQDAVPAGGGLSVRPTSSSSLPADIIFVGNFSLGYIHDRPTLLRYLRHCKSRLDAANHGFGSGGHGAFVCDLYGGAGAFRLGGLNRKHPGRGRETIHYAWKHESADPLTGLVTNSISFRIEEDGEITAELPLAFTYHWRLWSIPELKDAFAEAGFLRVDLYRDVNLAPDEPPTPINDPADLAEDWILLLAARA